MFQLLKPIIDVDINQLFAQIFLLPTHDNCHEFVIQGNSLFYFGNLFSWHASHFGNNNTEILRKNSRFYPIHTFNLRSWIACFLFSKFTTPICEEFSKLTHLLTLCKHISNNIWTFQWVEVRENKVMGELFRVRVHPAAALQHPAHGGVRHEPAHQDQGEGQETFWQVQGII